MSTWGCIYKICLSQSQNHLVLSRELLLRREYGSRTLLVRPLVYPVNVRSLQWEFELRLRGFWVLEIYSRFVCT